jgi:succinyl-CoA synthetase beta subunit
LSRADLLAPAVAADILLRRQSMRTPRKAEAMNIHEYQAKEILRSCGAPLLPGAIAATSEEAVAIARKLGGPAFVVKAQIHAGGRGKAGGVKLARSTDEVEKIARHLLGKPLVTPQTGPEGRIVHRVYVESATDIVREFYFSLLVDGGASRIAFVVSTEGGMDIEKVAQKNPEKIFALRIDPAYGYSPFVGARIAGALGLSDYAAKQCAGLCRNLYDVFVARDMSLLEINPLVLTRDGELFALDAKIAFDDNAFYRHKDVAALRDAAEEDPAETEAAKLDLSYVKLDGSIGCMVNGAGLAMATMDIVKLCGGTPANFLDVGGGATRDKVAAAFKIILADKNVKGVLVNIFGGIMKCDVIADGIVAAARKCRVGVPLVVRLAGTNVDKGKAILDESGLAIIAAGDLADAAKKIVAATRETA